MYFNATEFYPLCMFSIILFFNKNVKLKTVVEKKSKKDFRFFIA